MREKQEHWVRFNGAQWWSVECVWILSWWFTFLINHLVVVSWIHFKYESSPSFISTLITYPLTPIPQAPHKGVVLSLSILSLQTHFISSLSSEVTLYLAKFQTQYTSTLPYHVYTLFTLFIIFTQAANFSETRACAILSPSSSFGTTCDQLQTCHVSYYWFH